MRRSEVDAVITATPPAEVFDSILQFRRYPELAPHVQSVQVHKTVPGLAGASSWELHFRSGLLRWDETERFLRDQHRLEFEQTSGDFDSFNGYWMLNQDGDGTRLHFQVDFDFGIDSMAGILDPIADRVLKETVAWVIVGMFTDVQLAGDFEFPKPHEQAMR
ncbi:MAG TPA: SRPBCC family protein [Streptosporangiaceae bacterium]